MALRLRIRLKLLFGLMLIGIPMLMMLGAMLHALSAHRVTVKSIDSRQSEQQAAAKLQDVIPNWTKELGNNADASVRDLEQLVERLNHSAEKYEECLAQTRNACKDRHFGQEELAYLGMIRNTTRELWKRVFSQATFPLQPM